jgi:hypothetical protein
MPITTTTSSGNQDSTTAVPLTGNTGTVISDTDANGLDAELSINEGEVDVDNATTVLSDADANELFKEELPVTEGEVDAQIEQAAAVAAEVVGDIFEDELPILLVKEFYG